MKKEIVTPTEEERKVLGELSDRGEQKSGKFKGTLTPPGSDEGELRQKNSFPEEISDAPNTHLGIIGRLKKRFIKEFKELSLILSRINWL